MAGEVEPWKTAWAALQAGQPAEAERLCRPALQDHPDRADGWFLLGAACQCQGKLSDAADYYTKALGLNPNAPDVQNNLGSVLRAQGRTREAEFCYRQALELRPDFPEAHNNLGNVLRDLGRVVAAAECYAEALRLRPAYPEALHNQGVAHRELGRPALAEVAFRKALDLKPDFPDTLINLGGVLRDQGRLAEAADCYTRALRLRPNAVDARYQLGTTYRALDRPAEAADCFRRAVELRPDFIDAYNDLGNALRRLGRPAEAVDYYTRALRLRPDIAIVHHNLGATLRDLGRLDEAEDRLRRALELEPNLPDALAGLGSVLLDRGRRAEAETYLRQALDRRPDFPEALINLGTILLDYRRHREAAENFKRVLELRPDSAEAYHNLGHALGELGRVHEAEAFLRKALEIRPELPEALTALASLLLGQGRVTEAREYLRRALELRPGYIVAHDGLLLSLHYQADVTPEQLAAEHADYDRRHAAPLRAGWQPHANDRDPDRPLRLGLISADFRQHPVAFLLVRAVEALARRPGALVLYSERLSVPDDLTARFRAAATVWRDSTGLSDEQLDEQVRADAIDVLIDLAGHTGGNRLLTFARKPAPVQVTWLGYEGTTGLEAMDYLIADDRLIPRGAEAHYCEKVLRLPGGYVVYDPPADAPDPGSPPMAASGRVTFACFNNVAKLSPPALAAFAAVLDRVPGSRLVLRYRGLDDPAMAARMRTQLAAADVPVERVELYGAAHYADYLAAYREVDIALDPFPFSGGVTTCDALWMGVPVVTLPGSTFASRHGLSYLTSAGLADELVARDVDGYADIAARLAQDGERLAALRAGLRERMVRSPLCDGERLADELLAALRGVWRDWVKQSRET
jgi:predicted O-linked N-acetylglucosamine transferase (SPINDLY family)